MKFLLFLFSQHFQGTQEKKRDSSYSIEARTRNHLRSTRLDVHDTSESKLTKIHELQGI